MTKRGIRNRSARVRLSEAEFSALTKFAAEAGLTTSDVLRRLARAAGGFGPTLEGDAAASLRANVVQLRKVGVNLNQVARALNRGRTPGYEHLRGGIEQLARLLVQHERDLDDMRARSRARARQVVSVDV